MLRLQFGLAFVGPDRLARFGSLLHLGGSDLDCSVPYVEVDRPFKASPAPTLSTGLSGKVGHPIEPIRELEQFLSGFRDPGLPRQVPDLLGDLA